MRFALAALFCFLIEHFAEAQCKSDELSKDCIAKLSAGFNFLKTYKVENSGSNEKVEYSYVFTKGTNYMISLCAEMQPIDGISIMLFDSGRNQVASNKTGSLFTNGMIYQCNATGIYYIAFAFAKTNTKCAGCALGFKR